MTTKFKLDPALLKLLGDLGIPVREFLREARLPTDLAAVDDPVLDIPDYFRFWETLERRLGPEEAPFLVGRNLRVGLFNAPILAALCSADLAGCFERLARFKPLVGPMTLRVDSVTEGTSVELEV